MRTQFNNQTTKRLRQFAGTRGTNYKRLGVITLRRSPPVSIEPPTVPLGTQTKLV